MADYFWKSVDALCPDWRVRKVRARHHCFDGSMAPDTFFSVPARVTVGKASVRGYISMSTIADSTVETFTDPKCLKFHPYNECRPAAWQKESDNG